MEQIDRAWFVQARDQVLAAIPLGLLCIIWVGSLVKGIVDNPAMQTELQKYEERSAVHPHIYIRQLTVGPNHDDLTVEQTEALSHFIEKYIQQTPESNEAAYIFDKSFHSTEWLQEWSDSGLRAALMTEAGVNNNEIVQIYKLFSTSLRKLADRAHANGRAHISSMYAIGYTDTAADRETKLKNRYAENTLIDLTSHFLTVQGADVKIHTMPICLLTIQEIMPVTERLLSRGLRARYDIAGFIIPLAYPELKPTGLLSEAEWVAHRRWLVKETPYVRRLEQELEASTNWRPNKNTDSLQEALREARELMA